MSDIAVVIGGTGACGRWVIDELLHSKTISRVYSFVRRLDHVDYGSNRTKLTEISISEDPTTAITENWPEGAAVAFSCLGTTIKKAGSQEKFYEIDYGLQTTFAATAKDNGVKQFHLISSVGADDQSSTFYLEVKGKVEKFISDLKFPRFVAYRPGVLDAKREESRCGEAFALCCMKYLCCCLTCGVLGKAAPVPVRDVAMVMVDDYLQHRSQVEQDNQQPQAIVVDGSQPILRRAKQLHEERDSSENAYGSLAKDD